jgi:hypothetical protein
MIATWEKKPALKAAIIAACRDAVIQRAATVEVI